MSNIVTWRSYSKGKCIPTDALQLGSYRKDGQLYVGRRGEKGEVGKINAHGSNMKDLWTHDQGKTSNGDILGALKKIISLSSPRASFSGPHQISFYFPDFF